VLYISYDGMTDPLGESQVIPYLIGLSKKGYDFTILSFEKPKKFEIYRVKIKALLEEHQITWEPQVYHKSPSLISTLLDVKTLKSKATNLHQKNQYEIIHCRSYIAALGGLMLKKKFNLNFVFDMRGFWADERIDGNIWNLKNPLLKIVYNYFKRKEKEFIKKSDAIVSLTRVGKTEILNWGLDIGPSKITVIPCCADYQLFDIKTQTAKAKLKSKHGIRSQAFVFSYLGSLGSWYLLEEMLLFFKEQKKYIPNAKFLFINKGEHHLIKNSIEKLKLNVDDFYLEKAPREKVNEYLSVSDFGIFFIKPFYSKKASSPTKLAEYMAMGIPVVCNNNVGDVEHIVNETNAGVVLNIKEKINHNKVADELLSFQNKPEQIRNNSKKYFTLTEGIETYFEVYQKLR